MTPEARKVEALLEMGRPGEAAALADALPARSDPSPEFLRLRGRALRAAGRVFDAEASFRAALALAPSDAGLVADLATSLVGQARFKEAIVLAREAVALRPDVAAYQALLGLVAEKLALDEEAGRALGLARELLPGDPEVHAAWGLYLARKGREDDAERALREALALAPGAVVALVGLARVRASRGDFVGARVAWNDALRVDPLQRDGSLERAAALGHPLLAPARAAARLPTWACAALVGGGVALVFAAPAWGALAVAIGGLGLAARSIGAPG